ncbi:dioxygenase family protein [Streptomyces spiralis]
MKASTAATAPYQKGTSPPPRCAQQRLAAVAVAASHYRPAHVHCLIDEPGYLRPITHLFRESSEYLDSAVVFGTKEALVVRFTERPAGRTPDGGSLARPYPHAQYDFVPQPCD